MKASLLRQCKIGEVLFVRVQQQFFHGLDPVKMEEIVEAFGEADVEHFGQVFVFYADELGQHRQT